MDLSGFYGCDGCEFYVGVAGSFQYVWCAKISFRLMYILWSIKPAHYRQNLSSIEIHLSDLNGKLLFENVCLYLLKIKTNCVGLKSLQNTTAIWTFSLLSEENKLSNDLTTTHELEHYVYRLNS